jgi:hypothetical protein
MIHLLQETWAFDGTDIYVVASPVSEGARLHNIARIAEHEDDLDRQAVRCELAVQATALAQDVLLTEWAGTALVHGRARAACPRCGAPGPDVWAVAQNDGTQSVHRVGCGKDAVLTAIGLMTQAERADARKALLVALAAQRAATEEVLDD